MAENPNQPKSDDAVLGGQNPQPCNAAVLGSLVGVKRRLASGDVAQRIAALPEALKYGQDGLELLMHGLNNESWLVQCAAYSLLQANVEPALKQALRAYNPDLLRKCLHTFTGHSDRINSLAFSPDGLTLASGSEDKTIKLWDVRTGKVKNTLTGHSGRINSLAFSPDGLTLAHGSNDKTIKLWDTKTNELKSTLTESGWLNSIQSITFSPDGLTLASSRDPDNIITLWDVRTGEVKNTLTGYSGRITCVAFSPDGQTLASADQGNTINLWDVGTGERKRTLKPRSSMAKSVTFSPDGQTLASADGGNTINLWDVNTEELRSSLKVYSERVYSIAFSPDGQTLASGSSEKTIKLWGIGNPTQPKLDLVELFHRYFALKEALKSGQDGLDLLIQALKDKFWSMREAAYSLLQESEEPRVKQALQEYGSDPKYARMRYLLAAQRWKEAQEETENILLDISGCERGADVSSILDLRTIQSTFDYATYCDSDIECRIPDQDLRTIYDLWERYSNGRSSFKEQKSSLGFWIECKNQIPEFFSSRERIREKFAEEKSDFYLHGGYSHWD